MRDPRLPAVIVGCGDAGPARRPGCWPFFLAFNLRPSSSRRAVRLGTALGKPLFLLNLLFLGCRAAAVLDECAGGGVATGAACRALGKPVLADRPGTIAGGGAGEAGGTPQGCHAEGAGRRRRRRGEARSAEGRRARRALRRFGSRCRLSFPLIWPANYRQIFIGKLKGLTVPV